MIYFVACVASLAGLLFGFDEGVIAGALQPLRTEFALTRFEEGFMTAAVPLGALVGAVLGGALAGGLGRRRALILTAVLFAIGAIFSGLAAGVETLTLSRLVLGLAVGIAAMLAPLYISESAPAKQRGMLVSAYQLAITLGILGAYVVNYALDDDWRGMFMLGAVPALVLLLGMLWLKDTPRWLLMKNRPEQAQQALAKLRGLPFSDPVVIQEHQAIRESFEAIQSPVRWRELMAPMIRPALVVGIGLFVLQQFSGINAVIYYAPTVFHEAGFDSGSTQLVATIGLGCVNVFMTVVGMYLIDRIGRRRLLYLGFLGTALSLGLIALGAATDAQFLDVLAVVGLMGYIASFAVSIGPLPWVMMAEIFPNRLRGQAMSLTSLSNWTFNFLVVMSFPMLVSYWGLAAVFSFYALVCVIGLLFTWRYVPETSGVSLENIERHLRSGQRFGALRPAVEIQTQTDAADISREQCLSLMVRLIPLSPYRKALEPLTERIAEVAWMNLQVRTALRELNARVGHGDGSARVLRRSDLGAQRALLMSFLEHIRFASDDFLSQVGEASFQQQTMLPRGS